MAALTKQISDDVIMQGWLEHYKRVPDERFSFLRKLHDKQFALMGYLMKAEEDNLNESEHVAMYFLGSFVVGMMMDAFPNIPPVPEGVMVKARKLSVDAMVFLETENPENFRASMDDIIDASPQPDLLRFAVETLMRDSYFQESVREEKVWCLFAHLKIVIDAMSMSIPL